MLHDLSYLAGLVDGEGHVAISSGGRPRPGALVRRRFVIEISMTEEKIIDWLKATFGGAKRLRPAQKIGWKDQWQWRVQNSSAEALYAQLKPLLKIKNTLPVPAIPRIKRSRLDRNLNRAHE